MYLVCFLEGGRWSTQVRGSSGGVLEGGSYSTAKGGGEGGSFPGLNPLQVDLGLGGHGK